MKKVFFTLAIGATVFSCAKKTVPQASAPTAASNKEMLAAGQSTYVAKCGRCHDLPEVAKYTAKAWEPILDEMIPKAKMSTEEAKNVTAYVMANSKK